MGISLRVSVCVCVFVFVSGAARVPDPLENSNRFLIMQNSSRDYPPGVGKSLKTVVQGNHTGTYEIVDRGKRG